MQAELTLGEYSDELTNGGLVQITYNGNGYHLKIGDGKLFNLDAKQVREITKHINKFVEATEVKND